MLRKSLSLIPAFSIALATAAFAAAPQDTTQAHKGMHGRPGMEHGRPGVEFFVTHMKKELGLTDAQTDKVRALFQQDSAEFAGMKHDGMMGRPGMQGPIPAEFEAQLRTSPVDTTALNRAFEDRVVEMRKMHAAHVARFVQLHALLTPAQRVKLADLLEKRRKNMGHWEDKKGGRGE